ncbi:MAG: hypothetical protein LBG94_08375 [Treponema sp.]|jgi:predicted RNA-binding protein with TRAM domain|nr:hypothetical protein [Treponema sp.]
MKKITGSASARRIFCLLFAMCFVFSAVWAHGPGGGGDIEKSVTIAQWAINPDGAGVTRTGSGNHVLRLNVNIEQDGIDAFLAGGDGTLKIPFIVAHNSQRRVAVWTDLSGAAGEIGDYTFATAANLDAGRVVWTDPALMTGSTSATVTIPKTLLYNEATGRAATQIYVIFVTDNRNDASTETGNRGGSSRNNVNGVNLATEFNIFEKIELSATYTIPCPGDEKITITRWRQEDATVTRMGSGNHVLKLDISLAPLGIDAMLAGDGGTLDIPFTVAHNSQRRVAVWTDLSGAAGEVGDYTFATVANFNAGKVVWTEPVLATGSTYASVNIPKTLLFDEDSGKAAAAIYVIFVTDNKNDASTETGNRGGSPRNNVNGINLAAEFDIFSELILTAVIPCSCDGGKWLEETIFTHINLAPGANPSQVWPFCVNIKSLNKPVHALVTRIRTVRGYTELLGRNESLKVPSVSSVASKNA